MSTKLIPSIVFLFVHAIAFSQQTKIIESQDYDQLKKTSQLPSKFSLEKTKGSQTVLLPRIYPSAKTTLSNATCNILLPLDTTFVVVPFAYGPPAAFPPEYRNDDLSSPVIILPFAFCFFGQSVDSLYINNNGNISFNRAVSSFTAGGFPAGTDTIMIAPFWGDVDTRHPGPGGPLSLSGLVYYKLTSTALIIKWEHVGYYLTNDDKLNTFQLIITDGMDPLIPGGNNTAFSYGDMQWTTGMASSGTGGFGGHPATVGANLGDGINYIQFGRFDHPGYGYDGPFLNNDGVDWLDSSNFIFNLCPVNIPPISLDCNSDTLLLRVGDTTDIDITFIEPEIGQINTINVITNGLVNLTTISNTSGNLSRYIGRLVANSANLGMNPLTISATDNGTPAQTTTVNRVFQIEMATGIENNPGSTSMTFSPNPFTDRTILTISEMNKKKLSLIISDVTGREVKRVENIPSTFILEKGNLMKGMYLYQLTDGKSVNQTGKIVIQ